MLIARAFPVMQVYVKPGFGYFGYKGHTITLPHNVKKIASILPNLASELPIITFTAKGRNDKNFEFKVRRDKVSAALNWLISHNPLYRDVTLDGNRLGVFTS